jgi:hypothetical protein
MSVTAHDLARFRARVTPTELDPTAPRGARTARTVSARHTRVLAAISGMAITSLILVLWVALSARMEPIRAHVRLDFAYATAHLDALSPTSAALLVTLKNLGSSSITIRHIEGTAGTHVTPLSTSVFYPEGGTFSPNEARAWPVRVSSGSQQTFTFSVETLAASRPDALRILIAPQKTLRISLGRWIPSLVCVAAPPPGSTCSVSGLATEAGPQPPARILRQGGMLMVLTPNVPSRRVPSRCRLSAKPVSLAILLRRHCLRDISSHGQPVFSPPSPEATVGAWPG